LWAAGAMGNGLCMVVDSVDKCGKLCRTVGMFHVERWGDSLGAGARWVSHCCQPLALGGYRAAASRWGWVFHVELLGWGPGEEDALFGGGKVKRGDVAGRQEAEGAVTLGLADEDRESASGGEKFGGGNE